MKNLKQYLIAIVCFCLLALVIVLSIYSWNFDGALSSEHGDWGTFGDFVGGTLNPLFSFSGLIALLLTIVLQSHELEETRKELSRTAAASESQAKYISSQQQRDDLYRLIAKVAERINNNYNSNLLDNGASIHAALVGEQNVNENKAFYILASNMMNQDSRTYKIVRYLEKDLITLSELLSNYDNISNEISGQTTPLLRFYKLEYEEVVQTFITYGWFDKGLSKFYQV
ncbi:Hypothetical protein VCSRO12_3536 [Vibrio cholerae]|uniref:hypothetical protein n=1 Tax=Vibrio cholerae TaxID=666 RepID=UPI000E0C3624|nr:hypothetical protein [Vibrio cholerae]MBJ6954491.1 hypothetical protein [Vibrio cholerae]TXZ91076.1 hypothetical protein FXE42_05030 [Vibrio cholerae]GHY70727.1 Hypothetical protein VCSRO12_3536 [Vibrio cholerae]HDL9465497.1 hypothetical protein [Vibrio cholerae]